MEIRELRVGQGNVEIEAVISSKNEPPSFSNGTLCHCTLVDNSGAIDLTLWNDDVNKYSVGNKIKIINGYVSEFKGKKQLSSGRQGRIELVEEQAEIPTISTPETPKTKLAPDQEVNESDDEERLSRKDEDLGDLSIASAAHEEVSQMSEAQRKLAEQDLETFDDVEEDII